MRLFIAEKPSLAQAIASGLGNGTKKNGYYVIGNDVVTWCFGHILESMNPDEYDKKYKLWKMEDLPIIPDPWKLKVKPSAKAQYKIIKELIGQADEIVNAGDPDREGQLLIDEVLLTIGTKKPIKRILLNALDEKSVKEALSQIRDNEEFIGLRENALCRSRADWLVGMNLSRAYTIQAKKAGYDGTFNVGRVMTPTMALVVRREDDIQEFKPQNYFGISGLFHHTDGDISVTWKVPEDTCGLDSEGRLIDRKIAEEVLQKLQGLPKRSEGTITNVDVKEKKEVQRLPYSLSALQIDAGKRFGYSPQVVLDTMQSLYEKKLTTYPRSDCDYLPENQKSDASTILNNLQGAFNEEFDILLKRADINTRTRAWNDKKITAHHAIIPTTVKAETKSMNDTERNLYLLVAQAYLAQFLPLHTFFSTKITIELSDEIFIGKGRVVTDWGWKEIYRSYVPTDDETEDEPALPEVEEGENVELIEAKINEKTTKPPTRYTESTLLKAMKEIYKYVKDESLRGELKECSGIGTEATRAATIEKLIETGLLELSKKYLIPTEKARTAFRVLPEEILYPDTTALWEIQLELVQAGKITRDEFLMGQRENLTRFLERAKKAIIPPPANLPKCPDCGRPLRRHKGKNGFFWGCTGYPECKKTIFDKGGKPDFNSEAKCPSCQSVMKRWASKDNPKDFYWHCTNKECGLYLSDHRGKPVAVLCPECKKGYLKKRSGKKGVFWSCSNYPECKCTRDDNKGVPSNASNSVKN